MNGKYVVWVEKLLKDHVHHNETLKRQIKEMKQPKTEWSHPPFHPSYYKLMPMWAYIILKAVKHPGHTARYFPRELEETKKELKESEHWTDIRQVVRKMTQKERLGFFVTPGNVCWQVHHINFKDDDVLMLYPRLVSTVPRCPKNSYCRFN